MTKTEKRIAILNSYCMETLASMISTDKMQADLNSFEVDTAMRIGYDMKNVIVTNCLDLQMITFKTKTAKNDFFKALFAAWEI